MKSRKMRSIPTQKKRIVSRSLSPIEKGRRFIARHALHPISSDSDRHVLKKPSKTR